MRPHYRIQFFGYEPSPDLYDTLTKARKVLATYKKEDKARCRSRYKSAKVTGTKDSYKIEFGCNLYSAAAIVPY